MNLEELKSERKKVKDKLSRIKKYDKLELLRLHLTFDYREIRYLLNERKKELTKEINKLVAKEKREGEVKINLNKEINYIKKKWFKDYQENILNTLFTREAIRHIKRSAKEDLLKTRRVIARIINYGLEGRGFGHYDNNLLEKEVEEDFYRNTMNDKRYEKVIKNMVIKEL